MCGKLTAILTCEHRKGHRPGCPPPTCFLLHRVYRIRTVNFGIYTDAPNIRHLGPEPQSSLRSSCYRNRQCFLPNEWDRLSYLSLLACIGARHCIHGDGITIPQVYVFRVFPCMDSLQAPNQPSKQGRIHPVEVGAVTFLGPAP